MVDEKRDRTVEMRHMKIDELKENPDNPRIISAEGMGKLENSVNKFGFVNPVIVQKDTNVIIAGHQRLKAASAAGLTEIPVVIVEMDDEEAFNYNLADNRLAEESEWDTDKLGTALQQADEELRAAMGFDPEEVENVLRMQAAGAESDFLGGFPSGAQTEADTQGQDPNAIPGVDRTSSEYVQIAYSVTPEQRELIMEALKKAREQWELPTAAEAFVALCDDFIKRGVTDG